MPIVPRLDPARQLDGAPAPVLDRQQRPRVNNGTVVARLERLGDAAAQPMLPQSLAEPLAALGRVGESIARAGSIAGALARERQDVLDKNEAHKARQMFLDKKAALQAWIESPEGQMSPHLWQAKADQIFEGFKPFDDKSPISRHGRESLAMEIGAERNALKRSLYIGSSKQIFKNGRERVLTEADTAFRLGDYETGKAILDEGLNDGLLFDYERDSFDAAGKKRAESEQEEMSYREHEPMALANPWGFNTEKDAPGASPRTKARLAAAARAQRNGILSDDQDRIQEAFALPETDAGAIRGEEDIKRLGLRPEMEREAMKTLAAREDAGFKQWREEFAGANFVILRRMAEAYDPDQDPDGTQFAEMAGEIERMLPPGEAKNQAIGTLRDRLEKKEPKTDPYLKGLKKKMLDSYMQSGVFGSYTPLKPGDLGALTDLSWATEKSGWFTFDRDGIPEKDAAAIQSETDPWKKGELFRSAFGRLDEKTRAKLREGLKPKEQEKLDRVMASDKANWEKQRQAAVEYSKLDRQLDEWLRANPNATESQLLNQGNMMLPAPVRGSAAKEIDDLLKGAAEPSAATVFGPVPDGAPFGPNDVDGRPVSARGDFGKVTSYGYVNDETPDSNSTAGIGAFLSEKEQKRIKDGEDTPNKLKENDLAVSPDVEKRLRAAGIKPHDALVVKFADGTTLETRWMDRTAKHLTNRWDIYRAGKRGRHEKEAKRVVGFERISDYD